MLNRGPRGLTGLKSCGLKRIGGGLQRSSSPGEMLGQNARDPGIISI